MFTFEELNLLMLYRNDCSTKASVINAMQDSLDLVDDMDIFEAVERFIEKLQQMDDFDIASIDFSDVHAIVDGGAEEA